MDFHLFVDIVVDSFVDSFVGLHGQGMEYQEWNIRNGMSIQTV